MKIRLVQIASEYLSVVVLIGELRHGRPVWNLPFDPSFTLTDGLLKALFMRLSRIMSSEDFSLDSLEHSTKTYILGSGEEVYITTQSIIDSSTIFCFILRDGHFDNKLIGAIRKIADRGGVYTAKKFYAEVFDLINTPSEPIKVETLIPNEAFEYIHNHNWDQITIVEMASLLVIIGTDSKCVKGEKLIEFTMHMLSIISEDFDPDVMLDSAFVIASRYLENQSFEKSTKIFEQIALCAVKADRLALEISSRIRSARIIKLQANDNGMDILDVLSPIDDGSLEVASNNDREEYYCLQGYSFSIMGDMETAEDLYSMAIMISEAESFPTMNKAEAHYFVGTRAADRFNPEQATREFITASSIASRNGIIDMTKFYSHLAALQEIKWSKYLASHAVIRKMEADINDAKYQSWQSLKRLINAFIHSEKNQRSRDLFSEYPEIIKMTSTILSADYDDFAIGTVKDISNNLDNIRTGNLSDDNEIEILKFLSTKIAAMIPLPTLIVLLIAVDGRLITGGEIGLDKWDESISDHDELFSGALSAIMAVLSEVTASSEPLRMVDAGNTMIMIEKSKVCIGALLVDRELHAIRKALKKVVEIMQYEFPDLENWDGYSVDLTDLKPMVDEIFNVALKDIAR